MVDNIIYSRVKLFVTVTTFLVRFTYSLEEVNDAASTPVSHGINDFSMRNQNPLFSLLNVSNYFLMREPIILRCSISHAFSDDGSLYRNSVPSGRLGYFSLTKPWYSSRNEEIWEKIATASRQDNQAINLSLQKNVYPFVNQTSDAHVSLPNPPMFQSQQHSNVQSVEDVDDDKVLDRYASRKSNTSAGTSQVDQYNDDVHYSPEFSMNDQFPSEFGHGAEPFPLRERQVKANAPFDLDKMLWWDSLEQNNHSISTTEKAKNCNDSLSVKADSFETDHNTMTFHVLTSHSSYNSESIRSRKPTDKSKSKHLLNAEVFNSVQRFSCSDEEALNDEGAVNEIARPCEDDLTPAQIFLKENKQRLLLRAQEYYAEKNTQTDEENVWQYYRDPVVRPKKHFLWEFCDESNEEVPRTTIELEQGKMPSLQQIITMLQQEQAGDISLIDLEECGRRDVGMYGIVATGHTIPHCRRMGRMLWRTIRDLNIPYISKIVSCIGNRNDDWVITHCGPVQIHLFTATTRELYKLEDIWLHPHESHSNEEFPAYFDCSIAVPPPFLLRNNSHSIVPSDNLFSEFAKPKSGGVL
ncbi:hypothetical protein IE077_003072 [Cardiosporidium cionae]|uniref:Uncharacterized protein n=1 Tax=Cardiosporidium cionae TaxID=476202 RepID=A0ABQ7JF86_9APIC|nr:hypothetical protein IE077_003072 [Cardiosporidium cionae]|eukprot:KAF8822698.1 hypothetical protein IE077_003072 [Cardiosporidium cionae]